MKWNFQRNQLFWILKKMLRLDILESTGLKNVVNLLLQNIETRVNSDDEKGKVAIREIYVYEAVNNEHHVNQKYKRNKGSVRDSNKRNKRI